MSFLHIPEVDDLTSLIIGAAIEVHRQLGPGLFESVYLACLVCELQSYKVPFERQLTLPLLYKGMALDLGFRIDLVVDQKVIVEVKSIERFAPVHRAQLLTYLKLMGCPAGLLINFNVPVLKDGVQRVLNNRPSPKRG